MGVKGAGSSAQSMTVLQRSARLYEGERWWIFDGRGEVRGLLLFDGGEDLACLRDDISRGTAQGYRFCLEGGAAFNSSSGASTPSNFMRSDCQVTVEERTQLFGFLKKGLVQSLHDKG